MSAAPQDPAAPIRVMIVDGESAARHALSTQLQRNGELEVVGTAINARTALAKLSTYRPDVVTIDLVSSDVDGLALVRELRQKGALPGLVLMVADPNATAALEADGSLAPCEILLRAPAIAAAADQRAPAAAVLAAAGRRRRTTPRASDPVATTPAAPTTRRRKPSHPEVVGIGTSTGGPNALAKVLPLLPADFPLPVLVVQHMPAGFTASLAASLTRVCKLPVREAVDGEPVLRGQVLIAPGGQHMQAVRAGERVVVQLTTDPPEHSCRPSVDYLFRSLCNTYGADTVAVIMTGMGEDGLLGCRGLHAAGAWIVAQDEASCTVYGMPRGPIESGIADVIAPLDQLAARICEVAGRGIRP